MRYTFDDVRASTNPVESSKASAEDWIATLDRARDIALAQDVAGSYHSDNGLEMDSSRSSPNSTIHGGAYPKSSDRLRNNLTRSQASLNEESSETKKKAHRFSKRQSKNGLSTPF